MTSAVQPLDADARFAARLREYRESAGMSQGQVAEAMRDLGFDYVRQQTIDRIERGKQRPRLSEFVALASIVGAEPLRMLRPAGLARQSLRVQYAVRAARTAQRALEKDRADLASARDQLVLAVEAIRKSGQEDELADEISIAERALRETGES